MLYQEAYYLKHEEFQQAFSQYDSEQRVWIDECGLNRDLIRLHGRCTRHQRLYGEHSGKRLSSCISLIAAYCEGVLCDNATFHKSLKTHQLIASADCHLLFLPPYSPDFNKIEAQWANLKQAVRANQDSDLTLHQKLDIQLVKMSEC